MIYSVRAGSLHGYADLVHSLGQDPLALLTEAGLPRACLLPDREDDYLPLEQFELALALAANRCTTPEFPVLLGSRQQPQALLGALGYALQHASTAGAALQELRRYFFFQVRGARLELDVDGSSVSFAFALAGNPGLMASFRHSAEFCLGAGLSLMRQLIGARWAPAAVHFFHSPPSSRSVRARYQRLFDAQVRWDQPANALVFPRRDLGRPLASADAGLQQLVHRYLEQLRRAYRDDFKAQTTSMIEHALKSGRCSIDQVASLIGVHRRTLHRRLAAEGTTYRELVDGVRRRLARRLLVDSKLTVAEIAELLGYSETSALTRACQRWFGCSPRALRNEPDALASG
ncbi:MAG: AraC family transcriptional regulator ligand-binding domain-containing protein [Pseudomonadota bacterium]